MFSSPIKAALRQGSRAARQIERMANETRRPFASSAPPPGASVATSSPAAAISSVAEYELRDPRVLSKIGRPRLIHSMPTVNTQRQLIVTASGADVPGIVNKLSSKVAGFGGNVEESRMTRLAGDFSMVMLVTFDELSPNIHKSEAELSDALQVGGMHVTSWWASPKKASNVIQHQHSQRRRQKISVWGVDTPGITSKLSKYLLQNKINIESLNTDTNDAPFGDTSLFIMECVATLPAEFELPRLEKFLGNLSEEFHVDTELIEFDSFSEMQSSVAPRLPVSPRGKQDLSVADHHATGYPKDFDTKFTKAFATASL